MLRDEEIAYASGLAELVCRNSVETAGVSPEIWSLVSGYVERERLIQAVRSGKMFLWGAFEGPDANVVRSQPPETVTASTFCAVGGMQREGHVTMLYVLPQCQGRGIGKKLLSAMTAYGFDVLGHSRLTLSAMPSWTVSYFKGAGFSVMKQNGSPLFTYMELKKCNRLCSYKTRQVSEKTVLILSLGTLGLIIVCSVLFAILSL